MKGTRLWMVIVVTALVVTVDAQRTQFEVASVKLHTSDDSRVFMVAQPNGRFVAANIPLRLLIRTAYQLQDDQIVGGPDWLATVRFKLTTHNEKRELPVFALERSRRDGSFGPGLRSTACPDLAIDLSRPQPCVNIQTGVGSLTLRGMPLI